MVPFNLQGPPPTTARGNAHVFLVVDLFSHAEAYAITTPLRREKISRKVSLRGWSTMPPHLFVRPGSRIRVDSVLRVFQDVGLSEEIYELVPPTDERHGRGTEPRAMSNVVIPYRGRSK